MGDEQNGDVTNGNRSASQGDHDASRNGNRRHRRWTAWKVSTLAILGTSGVLALLLFVFSDVFQSSSSSASSVSTTQGERNGDDTSTPHYNK